MNDEDRDLRDAFTRLREDEIRTVPPFRVGAPRRRPMRLAFALAMLLLVVSIGYLTRSRPEPPLNTTSLSTWRAPTDFLLRTPGRELLTTTPQLKPKIPGGRA